MGWSEYFSSKSLKPAVDGREIELLSPRHPKKLLTDDSVAMISNATYYMDLCSSRPSNFAVLTISLNKRETYLSIVKYIELYSDFNRAHNNYCGMQTLNPAVPLYTTYTFCENIFHVIEKLVSQNFHVYCPVCHALDNFLASENTIVWF